MAVKSELKCPKCGNIEQFIIDGYIENHTAVVDGDGFWVEDLECTDAYISDHASVTCNECDYYADVNYFRE